MTPTQRPASQHGAMSPTWSVSCRRHGADMSACLSFWGEKIPDTTPTFPAKHIRMDACDHSKQGLESEISPETQNDPESEVTDGCDPSKKVLDKTEVSRKNF